FKIAMICSSLNLLRFILVRLLCVGLYSKSVTFQGRTSAGHHGAGHEQAAMIGYVQAQDIGHWQAEIASWIDGLVKDATENWSAADKFAMIAHDGLRRTAALRSRHIRRAGLEPIQIDHLWIEM
ncbi:MULTISPECIES: hypothetical protein, partial [unclassified Sphingomonas]